MDAQLNQNPTVDLAAVRDVLDIVLRQHEGYKPVAMARKWQGGTLAIQARDSAIQSKEIPIDQFLHKIVMVRERLRVLEQKINNHPKLDDPDRVELHQYITRIYGSLTTFNVLFADDVDKFVGQKEQD